MTIPHLCALNYNNYMTTEIQKITLETANDVISEIEQAFYDIPFENSKFQTEAFVIASQITPERAYRSIGLRMHAKLRALSEAKFARMKSEVDLDELEYKLSNESLDRFERRRLEIKREEMLSGVSWTDKLINDAISELNVLYTHFKKLPKYTRDQFEQAERIHFEQRLQRSVVGLEGAKESLVNMHEDMAALEVYQNKVLELTNATSEDYLKLTSSLPNRLAEVK